MVRSNRFVLATALATLAIALPSAVQARQKVPQTMTSNCLMPDGSKLEHGTSHIVIDDESCATANYWCNGGTLCYVINWDAVCGDQDFGAPHSVSDCYQSPAPPRLVTPVTPSGTWTTTTPTTSTLPNANLSPWY